MRSSLKLFTWFGIPVHLHWSFGLIFLYALWIGYANNLDVLNTIWLMVFFIALFACVLLHEYGHALTARRYGVRTQDIILTPIGGIARLERMPEKPMQEFLVAIAGPMVNVVLAILLFLLGKLLYQGDRWMLFNWILEQNMTFGSGESDPEVIEEVGIAATGLLFYLPVLVVTNIALVVFNLIPAFPMDGGRIFRALLAMRMGRVRATQVASWLGQGIAVLFVVIGLWKSAFTLALIGFFVFTTARAENNMVRLDALVRRFKARDLMRPQFTRLSINDWMQTPIALLQQGLERHFLVFDLQDHLIGVLEEPQIMAAMKKHDLSAEIGQYAKPQVNVVTQDERLEYVFHLLQQRGVGLLAVADQGELVGVIDQAGLQNFLRLNAG
ncbi:MAG: site-2 protease family protein [Lewinellaceae bacterium]|nr:site-2 protease family protein [Lewinellaceae bacterium]